MRYIDQIDADREAVRWLEARAKTLGADRIESHCHERSGRTSSAWRGNTLLAVTVVLRDELNWSVLTCHEVVRGPALEEARDIARAVDSAKQTSDDLKKL